MNIARIDRFNFVNGSGLRDVIWCSGCNHNCPGCHNKEAQDPNFGRPWSEDDLKVLAEDLSSPHIKGITFSGGEATFPANREKCTEIMKWAKENYPDKDIWVWTGYTYEQVKDLPMMEYVDVLVDGPFIQAQKPEFRHPRYRGSLNQRVIDVQKTRSSGEIVLWVDFDGKTSQDYK